MKNWDVYSFLWDFWCFCFNPIGVFGIAEDLWVLFWEFGLGCLSFQILNRKCHWKNPRNRCFFYIEHACCSAILSPRTVLGKWCHHRSSMYFQSITTKIEPSMLILVLLNPGIWTTQIDPRLQLLSGGEAISGQRHLDPTNTTRTLKGRLPPSQRSSLRAHHIKWHTIFLR